VGDVTIASARGGAIPIVVANGEASCVRQAAVFLQWDIERLTGRRPKILTGASGGPAIEISTRRGDSRWEAYSIDIRGGRVHIEGSNPRGSAFGVYELSERMGIDPLYHWTGYQPKPMLPFALKATRYEQGPPTFRYRGLFHDDEDILPRPFDARNGVPYSRGTVPKEWYERYFETALRLRMNQVAPYVRTKRHFEIQKMASDWGLFYSSHHYDILLSNPYGFDHFGLAKARGAGAKYDWFENREGMLRYWRAGVEENRELDAIYPVGLRGTDDYPYAWPKDVPVSDRNRVYAEAIRRQVEMTKALLPPGKTPIFHFTLYNEMLSAFRRGELELPEDVILVWDDNGDGVMRGLPDSLGKWKHGVYYHLAFFGGTSKQSFHTVQPSRIEEEFRKIVAAGATEYCLVNVSELREHVMETRFLSDIFWRGPQGFAGPDPAKRFVGWWSREYFPSAPAEAAAAYDGYYDAIRANNDLWYGSVRVRDWLGALMKKLNGEEYEAPSAEERRALDERRARFAAALTKANRAMAKMSPAERQFFFEHCTLGMLVDFRPVEAASLLAKALESRDLGETRRLCREALRPLVELEAEIRKAERPPFEGWYRPTWIRSPDFFSGLSDMNVHRPYEMMRRFLAGL
jgi:hypothetical protein